MEKCNCPKVSVNKFDKKITNWKGREFYTKSLKHVFHIPLGIADKINRVMMDAEAEGLEVKNPEVIIHDCGLFFGNIMVEVKKSNLESKRLVKFGDKRFYSIVSTEPWKKIAKGINQGLRDLKKKKLMMEHIYLQYLTCPVCSEKKGYKTIIFYELKGDKKSKIFNTPKIKGDNK